MSRRFGQGNDVDRNRPHLFHRDYWPLSIIAEQVLAFVQRHEAEMRLGPTLDYGAAESPYDSVFSSRGLELIKADIGSVSPDVLPIGADGRVPLADGSVRAIISTQVLEHVPEVQAYLREAHRLLTPGGLLLLSTHGAFVLHRVPTDLRRWMIDGLRYELESAGFKVETVVPKIGILAMSSHLRAITFGGLTRRIPFTGWLRPLIYLLFNIRMAIEDRLTPASVMESHPELLIACARTPAAIPAAASNG